LTEDIDRAEDPAIFGQGDHEYGAGSGKIDNGAAMWLAAPIKIAVCEVDGMHEGLACKNAFGGRATKGGYGVLVAEFNIGGRYALRRNHVELFAFDHHHFAERGSAQLQCLL
jgi:hypothetical protein